jgi:hypothetical protein
MIEPQYSQWQIYCTPLDNRTNTTPKNKSKLLRIEQTNHDVETECGDLPWVHSSQSELLMNGHCKNAKARASHKKNWGFHLQGPVSPLKIAANTPLKVRTPANFVRAPTQKWQKTVTEPTENRKFEILATYKDY